MVAIALPNLPTSSVRFMAVSGEAVEICHALREQNITVIPVGADLHLPEPTASHPDLNLCHLGGKRVAVFAHRTDLLYALQQSGLEPYPVNTTPSSRYPGDVQMNLLVLGKYALGYAQAVPSKIKTALLEQSITLLNIKQGYTKCSICVVNNDSLITDDISIAKLCNRVGWNVLLVEKGDVMLSGYPYGFIGGCSGLLAPDRLAFAGELESHRNFKAIKKFCRERGVVCENLISGPLRDIGSMIPLCQED